MGKSKGSSAGSSDAGVTMEEMDDNDRQVLFGQHKKSYEALLAKKKKADADFKNACKLFRSDLGKNTIAEIKIAIQLDSPEGEAQVKSDLESMVRVARWMGTELGTQAKMFSGEKPADPRAFGEGKRAGMAGEPKKTTYAPGTKDYDQWMGGYDIGYQALQGQAFLGSKPGAGIGTEKPTHKVQ
jgi:hypothetical protein